MTHSHDTSTPAMSAETVPSEEFVLVPREPTERMLKAADGWTDLIDAAGENTAESRRSEFRIAWKSMVEAAPNLSASHLAKEGEDDEETTLENRIDNAVQAMSETHHSWEARCHAIMAALGFNFGWKTPRVDEEPSPALAKGGDAVRVPPIEQTTTNDQIAAVMLQTGSPAQVRQALAYAAGNLGASTPTEGPASQTEGMGGDAVREAVRWSETTLLRYCNEAQAGRYPSDPREFERRVDAAFRTIRAALTPPETAEAVRRFIVGGTYDHLGTDPYYGKGFTCIFCAEDGWALMRLGDWAPHLVLDDRVWELTAPPAEAVPVASDLTSASLEERDCPTCAGNGEVVKDWEKYLHGEGGPEQEDHGVEDCTDCGGSGRIASDPALATDDRERLVKALRKIEEEAKVANDVIRLNRDERGQGRVRVATAMHRIAEWTRAALATEASR